MERVAAWATRVPRGTLKTVAELSTELARMKARYDELANEVRAAIDAIEDDEPPKLVMRRLRSRVKFGGRSWNDEEIVGAACEWFHRYGTSPTATDWNPAMVRAKNGSPEALERYLDGEWPSTATVLRKVRRALDEHARRGGAAAQRRDGRPAAHAPAGRRPGRPAAGPAGS